MSTGIIGDVQISVKTLNGDCFTVNTPRLEKIIDLKNKIAMETGLIPSDQILIYGGILLHGDDMKIEEYSVLNGSVIKVVARLRGGMQIFAKTMDGKTFPIEVQKTERIIDVKKKIQEKIGLVAEDQKLVFEGGILEDDKTVCEYQIVEKSVINIVAILRDGIQIFAKTMDGKTFPIEVQKTERIIDVKTKIQEKIGLVVDEQKLVFQGGILEDDKTVKEYQIGKRSVIKVASVLKNEMVLFAKTNDGGTLCLIAGKTERIIDLKNRIREKTRIDTKEMVLIYHGFVLEDERFIDECGIMNESVIEVYTKLKFDMKINVRTNEGRNISMDANKTEQVSILKRKIQSLTGLECEKQILIFNKTVLDDEKTVEDCKLIDGSIIHLIIE